MPFPNLDSYTPAQLTELQGLIFDLRKRRLLGEDVNTGSKNGKSYGIYSMSDAELSRLEDSLARKLNPRRNARARINFNNRCH